MTGDICQGTGTLTKLLNPNSYELPARSHVMGDSLEWGKCLILRRLPEAERSGAGGNRRVAAGWPWVSVGFAASPRGPAAGSSGP